jgi:hypothetical protein
MLGVLAGLLYALLLSAYDAYYQEFGVEPHDVGVSYLEVLSRAPVPLLYTLAMCLYGLAFVAIIALVVSLPVHLLLRSAGGRHRQVMRSAFTQLRLVAVLGLRFSPAGLRSSSRFVARQDTLVQVPHCPARLCITSKSSQSYRSFLSE